MNILYCGDKNIEKGLTISILSLLKNIKEELNIYVLTIQLEKENQKIEGVSDKSIEILNQTVQKENPNNFVKKIDITKLFEKEIPVLNLKTHFTPCCMLRLFADKIPELPDKILYLDNDVIVRKDFSDFYQQDMSKYELARRIRPLWKMVFQKETISLRLYQFK